MDPTIERIQPPAFEDGLGRRYTIEAGGESLEVLTVRQELAAAPSFEFAVRERATRLSGFLRACFGHVRSVERVEAESPALAVVSERTEGTRLSRILDIAQMHQIPFEIDAALCLTRQAVQAIALLHEHVPDVSHGAIAPERLIVTPNARLVVVDYVFGAALGELDLSRERYWKDLHIAVPAGAGALRLDRRADVTQVGAVTLAALLGRPLQDDEFPSRVADLIQSCEATTANGSEPLSSGLRTWLSKALQLDPRSSFGTAVEASSELEHVLAESEYSAAPAALQAFLEKCRKAEQQAPPAPRPVPPFSVSSNKPAQSAPMAATATPNMPADKPAVSAEPPVIPAPRSLPPDPFLPEPVKPTPAPWMSPATTTAATESGTSSASLSVLASSSKALPQYKPLPEPVFEPREMDAHALPLNTGRTWSRNWLIGAAVCLIAITSGITLATRQIFSPKQDAQQPGTLSVSTSAAGVLVVIDGYTQGRTPLTTSLAPGDHVIELVNGSNRRRIPVNMAPGGTVSQFVDVGASVTTTGKVQVRTDPAGARVKVDGNYFGSSPITVDGLTPGAHIVQVGDEDPVTEKVTIESGATASLVVPLGRPAKGATAGWISVSVPVDVQLFEGQNLIGSSRNSRIMVPPGKHQIELVSDTLGYRSTQTVQVEAGGVATIKPSWPKGTLALNALPWAEVRINGERIGETPIGSVSLPIGTHEIVFRHPELGEQRHQVAVTLKGPARLSVDLRKRP